MNYIKSMLAAFCRIVLAGIFWVIVRALYHVEFSGLEYARGKHPTFFAMAHKRDLDPLVEVPPILACRGWRALLGDVHFALRSDAFSHGFLGRIIRHPRWLARCLRPLSLRAILSQWGLHPLENIHIRPAEVWIGNWLEIAGDERADEVLTLSFLQHVALMSGEDIQLLKSRPLSHLLSWRYQEILQTWYSADIFVRSARQRIKQVVLRKLKQELADLTAWLSRGGSLWGSPEGRLSPDGKVSMFTPVLDRLLNGSPADTCVIPISISYDFMTTGRLRIFVNLALPIEQAPSLHARELELQLRRGWLQYTYFTCTQLASGFLVKRGCTASAPFTLDDLALDVHQQAVMLAMGGRYVDKDLLSLRSAQKLARRFLDYALRHKLVRSRDHSTWEPTVGNLAMQVNAGDTGYQQAPLAYAWNELREMLSAGPLPSVNTTSIQNMEVS